MGKRHQKSWLQRLLPFILIGVLVRSCGLCVVGGLFVTGTLNLSTDDNQPTAVAEQTYIGPSTKSIGTEPEAMKMRSAESGQAMEATSAPLPIAATTTEKQTSQSGGKVFPTVTSDSVAAQEPTLGPFFDCRLLVKQDYSFPEEFEIREDLNGLKDHDVVNAVTCQLAVVKKSVLKARVIGWFGEAKTNPPEWLEIQVGERVILISRRYVSQEYWVKYIPTRTPWPTLTPKASGGQVAVAGGKAFPTNTVVAEKQAKPTNTPTIPPTAVPTATPVPPTATVVVAVKNSGYTFHKLSGCPEFLHGYSGPATKMVDGHIINLTKGSYTVGGWWVIKDGKYIGVRVEYKGEYYLVLRGDLPSDISGCAP